MRCTSIPRRSSARILDARRAHRRGADWIGAELGIAASTVGRVIARAGLPRLGDCDALTGAPVRRGPVSRVRYERQRPGELVHVDIKKLGRIPEGGGWRAHCTGSRNGSKTHQYGCSRLKQLIDGLCA